MDIKFEEAIAFYISTKVFTAQTIIPIFISLYFVSDFIIAIFIRLSLHAKDDVWCNVIHFTKIFYRNLPISPIMSGRMIWQYEALWIVILQPLNRFKGFLFVWLQLILCRPSLCFQIYSIQLFRFLCYSSILNYNNQMNDFIIIS